MKARSMREWQVNGGLSKLGGWLCIFMHASCWMKEVWPVIPALLCWWPLSHHRSNAILWAPNLLSEKVSWERNWRWQGWRTSLHKWKEKYIWKDSSNLHLECKYSGPICVWVTGRQFSCVVLDVCYVPGVMTLETLACVHFQSIHV